MSSRQEEKERRRQEREALEKQAQSSAARRKRLGIVGIALAAIAAIVVIGIAVAGSGGDDGGTGGDGPQGEVSDPPAQKITNLDEAAEAAGCQVQRHRNEGADHTAEAVTYQTNPPTSGDHDPVAAEEGEYDEAPDLEQSVHSLEHGRINVQFKPGSPPERVAQLRGMVNESLKGTEGYKTLLYPNNTGMTHAVAATAWTRSLTCPEWNDQVFDAIRNFREDFVDKGPEFLP